MNNTIQHGCIQCHYPGCPGGPCPICFPQKHQHNINTSIPNKLPPASPYIINPSDINFNNQIIYSHKHDWQELNDRFICRICGKQVKKERCL